MFECCSKCLRYLTCDSKQCPDHLLFHLTIAIFGLKQRKLGLTLIYDKEYYCAHQIFFVTMQICFHKEFTMSTLLLWSTSETIMDDRISIIKCWFYILTNGRLIYKLESCLSFIEGLPWFLCWMNTKIVNKIFYCDWARHSSRLQKHCKL